MKITAKVLAPFIFSFLSLAVCVQFLYFPYLENRLYDLESNRYKAELAALSPIVAEELFISDLAKIHSILNSYDSTLKSREQLNHKPDNSISHVYLYSKEGLQLFPVNQQTSALAQKDLTLVQPLLFENTPIGHLSISTNINKSLIESQINGLQLALLGITLFMLIISVWWNEKVIIFPILSLAKAAKQLTKGNYNYHITSNSIDELGDLSTAFNTMTKTLSETNNALNKSLAEAKQATQTKSLFLANMSHEIRTPMNAIMGLSHLGQLETNPNAQKEHFRNIELSANNLLTIINDILDFSKIEAGKLVIETIPFDLSNLINGIHTVYKLQAEKANVRLTMQQELEHPYLMGDPTRINQILINLLSNAIKFSAEQEVDLAISSQSLGDNLHNIQFIIRDTGIGMSEDTLAHLFEEFSQADKGTTRKYGGTGLGLSITKKLVDLMKGEISVTSAKGKGSTFTVSLPMTLASKDDIKQSNEQLLSESCIQGVAGSKVLIVEDNFINQEVVKGLLDRVKIHHETAENGQRATELIETSSFDLVLMDIQMPVMDGYQATQKIRKAGFNIPIIALSANAMTEDRKQSLKAGMNDHLAKPIKPQELYQTLLKWLKK